MSYWFDVDKDDIELSDDGKTLNVRIDDHNHDWGNMYAQLPIDRVRELVAPSGWRDVREELPNDNDAYIVYDKEGSRGMADYCGNGQWGGWRDVTHWMPLPSPPEGVQG